MATYKILIILLVALSLDSIVSEEMQDKEMKVLKMCQEKSKASQDAVDKFHNMEEDLDETKEGKCLISCSLTEFGTMKADGTVDNDNAKEYIKATFPGHADKVFKIWKSCQEKETKGDDLCEYGYALVKCFIDEVTKEKIMKS